MNTVKHKNINVKKDERRWRKGTLKESWNEDKKYKWKLLVIKNEHAKL